MVSTETTYHDFRWEFRRIIRKNRGYNYRPMTEQSRTEQSTLNEEVARAAVDEASEKLGSDIVLLDTEGISSFADFS